MQKGIGQKGTEGDKKAKTDLSNVSVDLPPPLPQSLVSLRVRVQLVDRLDDSVQRSSRDPGQNDLEVLPALEEARVR